MAWYNFNQKRQKPKKNGNITFGSRFNNLFLQRVGIVNSYDDDIRTYIEKGYQQNPIVYSIVNMAAKNAGKAKWCIKDKNGNEIEVPLLSELLIQPNALQSWTDLIQDSVTHKLLEGNTFITGEYGKGLNSEKYNELYVLPSEDMQVIAQDDFRGIAGYRVDFSWSDETIIPATEVLHIKNPNPDFDETDNWLFGQSNFRAAARSIQIYNELQEASLWFTQNKGAQKILINKNDEMEMSPEAIDQLKQKLRSQSQGPKNNGNIPIIDGDLDTLDVSVRAKDALVLEQKDKAALEICNVTNFPPMLIGINDHSKYKSAKEAKKALWENVILPELNELKDGLNRWLSPKYGDVYLDFTIDHIDALREDRPVQDLAGIATVNEARSRLGLPKMDGPGGDELYLGFVQGVKDMDKPKETE